MTRSPPSESLIQWWDEYPYKSKKNFNTKWVDKAFKVYPNGKIELSTGTFGGKPQKPITIWVKELPAHDIIEIELVYDRRLMLSISFDDGIEASVSQALIYVRLFKRNL